MRRRMSRSIALCAVAAMVVAACGSDDDGAATAATADATATTPTTTAPAATTSDTGGSTETSATADEPAGTTDGTTAVTTGSTGALDPSLEPVTVYLVTDGDPASGSENVPAKDGLTAAVAALNARGGLLGHEVKVEFCQNPFSIDQAVQCVQDAVKDPSIVAFVGNSTNSGEQIDPIIAAAGIPIIAGLPLTPTQGASPNEFPIHIGASMFPAAGQLAAAEGYKRILVGTIQTEGTAGMEGYISAFIAGTDSKVEGSVSLPLTKPDLSAEAAKADAEADAVVMITDAATMGRFASSVAQLGSDVVLVTGGLTAGKLAMDGAGSDLNGARVVRSILPPNTDVPGSAMFLADMDAGGVSESAVDEAAVNNWLGVQILDQAATAAKSVAPGDVLAALNAMTDVETYGLTPPIDFSVPTSYAGGTLTRIFNPSVVYGTVKDGEHVVESLEWHNVLKGS